MKLDLLLRRVRQMHAALDDLREGDLAQITPDRTESGASWSSSLDFSLADVDLQLAIDQVIDNIACIKDHLRQWCEANTTAFEGDTLINHVKGPRGAAVAIVHDLWNIRKHGELRDKSGTPVVGRSGSIPKVANAARSLVMSSGTARNVGSSFMVDPRTGKSAVETTGSGAAALAIHADVVDEHGTKLGDFEAICEQAVNAWEETLTKAGVPLATAVHARKLRNQKKRERRERRSR